jgi:hypothetical protein
MRRQARFSVWSMLPNAEAAHTVHREAHGLVADEIYPVEQG